MFDREAAEQSYRRLQEIIAGSGALKTKLLLLRQFLESIYKKLSEDSKTSFNGLFARMQYVHSQLDFPFDLVTQVNQLRLLCNNVAHEDGFEPSAESYFHSIHALRRLLTFLCPEQTDSFIDEFIAGNNAQAFPDFKHTQKQSFYCVVAGWKLLSQDGSDTGIEIRATDDEGFENQILLNNLDGEGRCWSLLHKVLWEFCTLHCINLTPVKGKTQCYTSNPFTLLVVEPDFLLDASAVAECFTTQGYRPEYFIISRLLKEASQEKPTQGNIVNSILDEMISSDDADYKTLFRKCMGRQPISIVALGKASALSIYRTIRDVHLPRISEFAESVKDDAVQLEPTYINPDYGLQGRLDILFSHAGKQHIVELKSGNPPRSDVWINHQMQVVAYNLIIRDCYPKASLGTSCILYSAAAEGCLRHVVNTLQLEQSLIMCRNRIVGIMHGLALDPSTFFGWLLQGRTAQDKGFMQDNLQTIVTTLKTIAVHEYEWFLEQLRLIVREIWFEKTGGLRHDGIYGHNSLWQESVVAKSQRYRLLGSLKVESVTFNKVIFRLPGDELITDFRADDIVVLYRQNTPLKQQEILRGSITCITAGVVEVLIRGGLRRIPESFRDDLWALEHDILEASLYSPLSSVFSFLQAPAEQRNLFLGNRKPECGSGESNDKDSLDGIIDKMLAAEDYYIVQGPPGTGKTSGLLTSYIARLFGSTPRNILILSFTNRAVDEICLNLKKQAIPFIRTGHSDEVTDELMDNLIEGKKFDDISAILKSNRVWVATVQSCNAWLNDILKLIHIDELVIDEASQIMENAILGIIAKVRKTIFIGDQNQLPPISRQAIQVFHFRNEVLNGLCYGTYNQSLMERLNKICRKNGWTDACKMLHNHYRMHEDIAGLIQRYYFDSLTSMQPRQKEALQSSVHPLLTSRLVWIEFPPSLHAYYDLLQVESIRKILDLLVSSGLATDIAAEVGIVAPFRAMIHALLQALPPAYKGITIDTVERFQGSERKFIIITLPLHTGSALHNIEALSSDGLVDRKLNVAVSRAQERLIVLGCRELCRSSGHYNLLMDKIALSGKMLAYNEL